MRKLLVTNLLVLAGLLALAEVMAALEAQRHGEALAVVRLARRLKNSNRSKPLDSSQSCSRQTSWSPNTPYRPHPTLGYWYAPNSSHTATIQLPHTIARQGIEGAVNSYQWSLTTGPQGERLSRPATANKLSNPAVLLLGDSFIFGAGLSDNASLAWQLQSLLPNRPVANYAGGGFGTVHQWLMLRDANSTQDLIPPALRQQLKGGHVLLGHADYYFKRNVAAPSRLRTFNPRCGSFQQQLQDQPELAKAYTHPRAELFNGELKMSQVRLFQNHSGPDPDGKHQRKVTIALVDAILKEVKALDATPVVLWLRGSDDDVVISHYRQRGVAVLDLRGNTPLWTNDNLEPFDNHPGPLSTTQWASAIAKELTTP